MEKDANIEEKEKRLKLRDLMAQHNKLGDEVLRLVKELGYGFDENEHKPVFSDIFARTGFYISSVDKVENRERDMYILKVARIAPNYCIEGISS